MRESHVPKEPVLIPGLDPLVTVLVSSYISLSLHFPEFLTLGENRSPGKEFQKQATLQLGPLRRQLSRSREIPDGWPRFGERELDCALGLWGL